MLLSLLILTQICCSDKFAFLFCDIQKFASNLFQIFFKFASNSFQLCFKCAKKLASIRFREVFTPFSSFQIPYRSELICLKMKWKFETISLISLIKKVIKKCQHKSLITLIRTVYNIIFRGSICTYTASFMMLIISYNKIITSLKI